MGCEGCHASQVSHYVCLLCDKFQQRLGLVYITPLHGEQELQSQIDSLQNIKHVNTAALSFLSAARWRVESLPQ